MAKRVQLRVIHRLQKISDEIIPEKEYEKMLEEIEEFEDVRLYDEAKTEDDGSRVLLTDYLKKRKASNA